MYEDIQPYDQTAHLHSLIRSFTVNLNSMEFTVKSLYFVDNKLCEKSWDIISLILSFMTLFMNSFLWGHDFVDKGIRKINEN